MSTLYQYIQHPWVQEHKLHGPVKVEDQRPHDTTWQRINAAIGLRITVLVGTMLCAYVFAAIALISLPSNIHSTQTLILWISSSFLQLVLLPIIIVGQNIQAKASDKRSEDTYNDAAAILHEALQIQHHLEAQDEAIERILGSVAAMSPSSSSGSTTPPTPTSSATDPPATDPPPPTDPPAGGPPTAAPS
jgi:hypothetical protein